MISSARRFRFGGKKEAAGAAVAVMLVGIMDSECGFVNRSVLFGACIVPDGDGKW